MKATAVANPVTLPISSVTIEMTGEEAVHLLTFLGTTLGTTCQAYRLVLSKGSTPLHISPFRSTMPDFDANSIMLMYHDDSCGELLDNQGKCPTCGFHPDGQSVGFVDVSLKMSIFTQDDYDELRSYCQLLGNGSSDGSDKYGTPEYVSPVEKVKILRKALRDLVDRREAAVAYNNYPPERVNGSDGRYKRAREALDATK